MIHSGIYYAPGSLKADLCKRGERATKEFCAAHGIPFVTCGKTLVATNALELVRLEGLVGRARENGIEVERLDQSELRRREPNITGLGALFVPSTAIVDYRAVCAAMARVIQAAGAEIVLGAEVTAIRESAHDVVVRAGDAELDGAVASSPARACSPIAWRASRGCRSRIRSFPSVASTSACRARRTTSSGA